MCTKNQKIAKDLDQTAEELANSGTGAGAETMFIIAHAFRQTEARMSETKHKRIRKSQIPLNQFK